MAEQQSPNSNRRFRLTGLAKSLLGLTVLIVGFIGVQIWMEWDDTQRAELERVRISEKNSSAKKDVESLIEKKKTGASPVKSSVVTPETNGKKDDGKLVVSRLPEIDLYVLQVGTFSDAASAKKLVQKLAQMGFGGTVIQEADKWKVISAVTFQKDQGSTLQAKLEESNISGFTTSWHIPSGRFKLSGESQRLTAFIEGTAPLFQEWMKELSDAYCVYEGQGFDAQNYKTLILKQKNLLAGSRTTIENMTVSSEDVNAKEAIIHYLQVYQSYLDRIGQVKKLDRPALWGGLTQVFTAYESLCKGQ